MPRVTLRDRRTLAVQVLGEIRELIREGQITPGQRLPSEAEFAEMYGVGRTTVREAVKTLEHDGIVETQQGRGRFVAQHARALLHMDRPLSKFQSISALLAGLSYDVEVEVLSHGRVVTDLEVATALGITENDEALHVRRLRRAGRDVLVYSDTFINIGALGVDAERFDFTESILETLESRGHQLSYAASELTAVRLPPEIERVVGAGAQDAWLLIEEVCMSDKGKIMLFSKDYYHGPKFTFNLIRRGDGVE